MANGSAGYARINQARKAGTGKPSAAKKRGAARRKATRQKFPGLAGNFRVRAGQAPF